MPGIETQSISDVYQCLTELPLKEVLRTHIISDCGRYLMPVKILITPAHKEVPKANPYYNYELPGNAEYSQEELTRLYQHSAETQALSDIQKALMVLESDDKGLLGQLQKLEQALHANGKHGIGTQEYAGNFVYPAIHRFSEY